MAFVKVDKGARGTFAPGAVEIRMGAHLQNKKGEARGIYFSMSEAVIEQVGWKITISEENEDRRTVPVDVQEGVGDDAGFLLIVESVDPLKGYALGTTNVSARSYSMSVSMTKMKHYVLNEVPVPSQPIEFTVEPENNAILIQCPDWLRYNPLSYTEPPKPVVQEVKKPSPPTKPEVKPKVAAKSTKELAKEAAKDLPDTNRKQRRALVAAVTRAIQ